jgi:site-specific recombinase XerC
MVAFGKIMATSLIEVCKDETLDSAVAKLMVITDGAEITRWVQFPRGLLLFVVVPGDPESGALHKEWSVEDIIPAPKKPQKLPVVLSPEEVLHFLGCVTSSKHRTILTTCYAAGLRVS